MENHNQEIRRLVTLWELQGNVLALPDVFGIRITADDSKDRDVWTVKVAAALAEVVGGASVSIGEGYWYNSDSKLVVEPSVLIEANCANPMQVFADVAHVISAWMRDTHQESAWLRFNDVVVLVEEPKIKELYASIVVGEREN